jgi:hypothetical protein
LVVAVGIEGVEQTLRIGWSHLFGAATLRPPSAACSALCLPLERWTGVLQRAKTLVVALRTSSSLGTIAVFRRSRPVIATKPSAYVGRTSTSTFTHFAHRRGKLHEFLTAELIVMVLVEMIEKLVRIRRTVWARPSTLPFTARTVCTVGLTAEFRSRSGSLFVVELSVAVGIERLNHALPTFSPIGLFIGCVLGNRRSRSKHGCPNNGQ